MSDEVSKEKRSTRLHDKETKVKKQVKIAKAAGIPIKDAHRFAKLNAVNCGNPKCFLCSNPRKVWKEKTFQEKSFFQKELYDEPESKMPE